MKKIIGILKSIFSKDNIIKFLKGRAVKFALKKLLGSAVIGGPKAWIIKYVVVELFEEIAEPLLRAAFVQIGFIYDSEKGKIIVKKLDKAKEENNEDDYNTAIDDLLS